MSPENVKRSLLFLVIAFGPGLVALSALGALVVGPVLAFGPSPLRADRWQVTATALETVAVILVPLAAAVGVSLSAPAARSVLVRGLLVFTAWQIIALACSWVLSSALAGVSMAVADGVASGSDLASQKGRFALVLLGIMQLLIVPWTVLAVWFLRRAVPSKEESGAHRSGE